MPPPGEPVNPQNRRRRQESMPGGWLWLVILLLLAVILWFTFVPSTGTIDYSDFMTLAKEKKFEKVIIKGTSRAIGELKESEVAKLKEDIKRQVRYNKVETAIPDRGEMIKELRLYGTGLKQEEKAGTWVGRLLMMVLPAVI